jgi:hypothetical protein
MRIVTLMVLMGCVACNTSGKTDGDKASGAIDKGGAPVPQVVEANQLGVDGKAPKNIDKAFDIEESKPADLDKAFDIEESKPANLDKAFDIEENKPADFNQNKIKTKGHKGKTPGAMPGGKTPGIKPGHPSGAKPYSPGPVNGH